VQVVAESNSADCLRHLNVYSENMQIPAVLLSDHHRYSTKAGMQILFLVCSRPTNNTTQHITSHFKVEEIMGSEDKGKGLSFVSLLAGMLNLFTGVFFGAINDRFASQHGKRRIWILLGAIGMSFSLFFLTSSSSLYTYSLVYLVLTSLSVVASVPFNGLLADVTHPEQKGVVSSIMGFCTLAGNLAGAILGAIMGAEGATGIVRLYYVMVTAVLITASITVFSTKEVSSLTLSSLPPISWRPFLWDLIKPLVHHRDFRLVFVSRFLYQLGIATVQQVCSPGSWQ
jgi:Na+/melibiose symporter-like transporter